METKRVTRTPEVEAQIQRTEAEFKKRLLVLEQDDYPSPESDEYIVESREIDSFTTDLDRIGSSDNPVKLVKFLFADHEGSNYYTSRFGKWHAYYVSGDDPQDLWVIEILSEKLSLQELKAHLISKMDEMRKKRRGNKGSS